jgi:hypothetical protein
MELGGSNQGRDGAKAFSFIRRPGFAQVIYNERELKTV